MNLITRIFPALILGLSGLALSSASQAGSSNSYSISISSGYAPPRASYVYHDSYRPYVQHNRPPVHTDTYVEKHVYRSNGLHGRNQNYGEHGGYRNYGYRNGSYSRGHSNSYARITHY